MKKQSRNERIPGYLYALDGLRALSLLLIVMFHTWQQSWIFYQIKNPHDPSKLLLNLEPFQRYGYIAIDSFFVLSGFCLFYPIARAMFGESKFSGWKQFFIKRARRIYPSYIIILLVCIIFPVISQTTYDTHSAADIFKHFIYHVLFIHNTSNRTISSMAATAWTLSVECQFYILFPLICIPFRKKPIATFAGMCIIAAAFRLWLISFGDLHPQTAQAITPTYFDVFGFGMLAAYFVVYMRNKVNTSLLKQLKPYMTAISFMCIFAAGTYLYWLRGAQFPHDFSGDVYFRCLYRGIFAALIAGFIFSACFSYDFWEKKIWGNAVFRFMSAISYTVYLWHQNIYIMLKRLNIPHSDMDPVMHDRPAMIGLTLICLISSTLIAIFVTYCIENPIAKYGYKGCLIKISNALHITKENKKRR